MLVLTRKPGQSIRVGEDVEIIVVEVRGDQVRLGIRAPRSVSIVRGEILDDIREENRAAAQADADVLAALNGLTDLDSPSAPSTPADAGLGEKPEEK